MFDVWVSVPTKVSVASAKSEEDSINRAKQRLPKIPDDCPVADYTILSVETDQSDGGPEDPEPTRGVV